MLSNINIVVLMASESFRYLNTLEEDDYNEMVSQLASSLDELCDAIFKYISTQ